MLVPGAAAGAALVLEEPLSLWGGLDPVTGEVIDRRHPQVGETVRDRIVVMPFGRGSSSASSVLLEAVRLRSGPAALLLAEVDGILALGAVVARELYDRAPPVAVVPAEDYGRLETGAVVTLSPRGTVTIETGES